MAALFRCQQIIDQSSEHLADMRKLDQFKKRILDWILAFLIFFASITLFILAIFNPQNNPVGHLYCLMIVSLDILLIIAFILNHNGCYKISAAILVMSSALTPWASLIFDSTIIHGDFVPLTYLTFSVLLSSILLPICFTMGLTVIQFLGSALFFWFIPAEVQFNLFSFLAFLFLITVFSIIANYIIQRDMQEIDEQAYKLRKNEERLQELSIRDYLTNLFNRRYLQETLRREIDRAERNKESLSIIMIDIDHFKEINDTLGHAVGDKVLKSVGAFVAEHIRIGDIACRYGGDEFVLVLPDASLQVAQDRAQVLQDNLDSLELPMPITFSFGIAMYPEDGSNSDSLLRSADIALYQAKDQGRDRVQVAET